MENRKRPSDAVSASSDAFSTPKKRVSVVPRLQDYTKWGVDETCQYLLNQGFGEWQEAFRGRSSVVESWYGFLIRSMRFLIYVTQHKRSQGPSFGLSRMMIWRTSAWSKSVLLLYIYIYIIYLIQSRHPEDRVRMLHSFRKLWPLSAKPHKVSVFLVVCVFTLKAEEIRRT